MRGIRASQHTCQTLHQSCHTFFIHVIMVREHLGWSCKDSFISAKCCVEVVALSRSVHYYISIGEMSELRHLPQFKCRQKDKKEWFNTCQALFFIERFRPLSSDEPPPHSFLVELMPDNALVCLSFVRLSVHSYTRPPHEVGQNLPTPITLFRFLNSLEIVLPM